MYSEGDSIVDNIYNRIEKVVKATQQEFYPERNAANWSDMEFDSLPSISLALAIESEFEINFPDEFLTTEALSDIDTLADIINRSLIERQAYEQQI
jgi:acyl carrier protein